jgi:hypothetical protein
MTLRVENIERAHLAWLAAAVCVAAAGAWGSPRSLLAGGTVMAVNFWLLRHIVVRLVGARSPRRTGVVMGLLLAKFAVFMGLLAGVMWRVPIDAASFAAGTTLLFVACVGECVRGEWARV